LLSLHFYRVIQGWWKTPKRWTLRYKATIDGFSSAKFHEKCDNIGSTVTLIHAKDGNLLGGYTKISWVSQKACIEDDEAFIFILEKPWPVSPRPFYAQKGNIYCSPDFGPTFGHGFDIHVANNCNSNTESYIRFPFTYRDTSEFECELTFTAIEIEVFLVE